MRGYKSFFTTVVMASAVCFLSMSPGEEERKTSLAEQIGRWYEQEMVRFDSTLQAYPAYFYDSSYTTRKAKFQDLAYRFKRTECLLAYFDPKLAYETFLLTPQLQRRDFGPPFPDNWIFIGPFGIENDSSKAAMTKEDLAFSVKFIERAVKHYREWIQQSDYRTDVKRMNASDVIDAMRLQLIRLSTVGIANADLVIDDAALPALRGAFDAWRDMMLIVNVKLPHSAATLQADILQHLEGAQSLVHNLDSFNALNRMKLLTSYLLPLGQDLNRAQAVLKITTKKYPSACRPGQANIYDLNAFNEDFFTPGKDAYLSAAKAELGKLLFFDPVLSGNNERACASCHKPELAFTDGNIRSLNFERGSLARNAPTVINAVYQKSQFWDLRATSLEDQLDSVINNADELHSSFDDVIGRLNGSEEYTGLFHAAFPETKKTGIQRKHVKIAIASYERMLTGMNSRFDQYMRGDTTRLTSSEVNGFNIYMGKAKCGTCHYAPLFAGALPPYFEIMDQRAIGVPLRDSMKVYEVDIDTGASRVTRDPFSHFAFKVPTIRNIELTAPYMHNGVFKTLEQVVDFYNEGAGMNFIKDMRPGMKGLPFFMILPDKLNLTPSEKKDLIAFMKALTDTSCTKNIPTRLPTLSGAFASLNERKLGGNY